MWDWSTASRKLQLRCRRNLCVRSVSSITRGHLRGSEENTLGNWINVQAVYYIPVGKMRCGCYSICHLFHIGHGKNNEASQKSTSSGHLLVSDVFYTVLDIVSRKMVRRPPKQCQIWLRTFNIYRPSKNTEDFLTTLSHIFFIILNMTYMPKICF